MSMRERSYPPGLPDPPGPPDLVVVLLLATTLHFRLVLERRLALRAPRRRVAGVIAAFVAAADLLGRIEAFKHEIHARRQHRRRRLLRDAGLVREIDQALH